MENKEIKLSIVAAVYNLEKYLPRCLDAISKSNIARNRNIMC